MALSPARWIGTDGNRCQYKGMIAFIDTEVGVDSQRVWDYGAVREDGAVRVHSLGYNKCNLTV